MRTDREELPETPEALAAEWMAQRRSGAMTAVQAREFDAWLQLDPANRRAFEELEAIWDEAGLIREDPTILALREQNFREFNRPARLRLIGGAMAACAALAVAGGWMLLERPATLVESVSPGPPAASTEEQILRTGVGQTTTATLKDGSTVILDSDTVLRAVETPDERSIHLERGGAFFHVAKDPSRPFKVVAADKTITAIGTAFEARIKDGELDVTLIEGKVKVEAKKGQFWQGQQAMDMAAGWRLTAPEDKRWSLQRIDTNKELSWISGRLTFFNDPLGEAVTKVNRYSDRKIVVDPDIAEAPIVGVFETGDPETFVRGMELAGIARIGRTTDTSIELVAP